MSRISILLIPLALALAAVAALPGASATPVPPPGIVVQASLYNTCFLFATGDVDCQGYNAHGQNVDRALGDVAQVAVGGYHTCFLLTNGDVTCAGANWHGQRVTRTSGDAIAVAAGSYGHTCILLVTGNVDCAGDDRWGQSKDRTLGDVTAIAAGEYHTCFLLVGGNVACQGSNNYGQAAPYNGGDAVGVWAFASHTCILLTNGNVDCRGYNAAKQADDYLGGDAIGVATGTSHTCILRSGGNVNCYGSNGNNQFADRATGDAVAVAAGHAHTCTLLSTGNVDCNGYNAYGHAKDLFDQTPPTLTIPPDETVEATGPEGAIVAFEPSAFDAHGGVRPVTCTPASGSAFPVGVTTVDCTATDAAGNAATGSLQVTVTDTSPPAWGEIPEIVHVEATSAQGAPALYAVPIAQDIVDGATEVVCAPANGETVPMGDTTVTCDTSDARGNAASVSFTLRVADATAPAIAPRGNEVVEATGPEGATVLYAAPSWSDVVDGEGAATCSPTAGGVFALGATTVNCTTTDAAGNVATPVAFDVVVQDTTAPVLAEVADLVVQAKDSSGTAVVYAAPTWQDAVDGSGEAACAPASGSLFPSGETVVACEATDAAGNTGTTTFVVRAVAGKATAPRDVSSHAGPGPTESTLTWSAPARDGGAPVTAYLVFRLDAGEETLVGTVDETSFTVPACGPTETCRYVVRAQTVVGNGDASDAVDAPGVPGAPSLVEGDDGSRTLYVDADRDGFRDEDEIVATTPPAPGLAYTAPRIR